jgi:dCMP deaminase
MEAETTMNAHRVVSSMSVDDRPDWTDYFMSIASVVASRSTCLRRQVGAVIVRGRHIVSTGYNGAPRGVRHCTVVGCLREELGVPSGERHEICRGSHAEINAIVQAAATGSSTEGAELYCTHEPCSFCTKAIINAGIHRIVFASPYPDPLARTLREEAGVEVEQVRIEG